MDVPEHKSLIYNESDFEPESDLDLEEETEERYFYSKLSNVKKTKILAQLRSYGQKKQEFMVNFSLSNEYEEKKAYK